LVAELIIRSDLVNKDYIASLHSRQPTIHAFRKFGKILAGNQVTRILDDYAIGFVLFNTASVSGTSHGYRYAERTGRSRVPASSSSSDVTVPAVSQSGRVVRKT
jgi:hypothetical protein